MHELHETRETNPAGCADAGVGRRWLFAGAAAVAGTGIMASAAPAEAAAVSLDWFNVMDYGAKGDGSTPDTAAIQSAIDAAAAAAVGSGAKGGVVYFPRGQYLVDPASGGPALSVNGDGVRLVGAGAKAATLVKGSAGILLSISGTGTTGATGTQHRKYCSVESLGFNGNGQTGSLLELYYADNLYFRDVFMSSNKDLCLDIVELWDSRFYNLVIESSTGTANSTTQPNVWLRNSTTATVGAWGYSGDNNNQIHFIGCRMEAFGTGALWINQGTGSTNSANGIYLTDCKFESSSMQGGPHLWVDASCRHVYATNIYCYAGNFAAGYSTPRNIISWAPMAGALENVLIANGSVATVNSGVDAYSGSTAAVLRNVVGLYNTAPTGAHIYFEASSTGDFLVENCTGSVGAQVAGTIPVNNAPNPPLRLVAGAVSDASFKHTPVDGTMAVDKTNDKLYVRVNGTWRSAALS